MFAFPLLLASDLNPAPNAGEQAAILRRIQLKGRYVFDNFAGIRNRRHSVIQIRDGDSGELQTTIRLTADRLDYYDRMPEVTVIRYNKNDRELFAQEFENAEFAPPLPLFDEDGEKNYRFRLMPPVTVDGVLCHRLRVDPVAATRRHFVGDLYFTVQDLQLKYLKGSYARLQIGLQSFSFEFYFSEHPDGVPVFTRGRAEGRVYFPLVRNESIVSYMKIENQEPVRRGPRFER